MRSDDPAAHGAIQRAPCRSSASRSSETTVDATGHLVSMRFQPRDARAPWPAGPRNPTRLPASSLPAARCAGRRCVAPDDAEGGGLIGPVQIEFLEGLGPDRDPRSSARCGARDRDHPLDRALAHVTVPTSKSSICKHVTSDAMASLVNTIYDQQSCRPGR